MNKGDNLKPSTIMRYVYGVYPSFAMLAAMQLDIFTPLKDGPMEAKALACALDVQEEKLIPLLYSLVAADLLTLENQKFSNTPEADRFLVQGRPDYIGGLNGFYRTLWNAAMNTAESIKTGRPKLKMDWNTLPEEELLKFFRGQFHSSARAGKEIANRLDFSKFNNLLDAGGGTGGVSIAVCEKFHHIKATVADVPNVARVAGQFVAEAGMSGRISVSGIDLCSGAPEGKYDVAILRAFIQTISHEQAKMAVKNIGQSIMPGGRIYIMGSFLDNSRLSPPSALGMGLVFLNFYDHGKAYTENEQREMLENAGFIDINVEYDALVDGMSIISAKKE